MLAGQLPPGSRLLGVDLGSRTIGLAISDPGIGIASPIGTLRRTRLNVNAQEIDAIARERGVGGMVIGLPLNMDGTAGPRAQATSDWARDLATRLALPITFWDERMSTLAVERVMLAADMTRKRRAAKIDSAAAAYILQGALDSIK